MSGRIKKKLLKLYLRESVFLYYSYRIIVRFDQSSKERQHSVILACGLIHDTGEIMRCVLHAIRAAAIAAVLHQTESLCMDAQFEKQERATFLPIHYKRCGWFFVSTRLYVGTFE